MGALGAKGFAKRDKDIAMAAIGVDQSEVILMGHHHTPLDKGLILNHEGGLCEAGVTFIL